MNRMQLRRYIAIVALIVCCGCGDGLKVVPVSGVLKAGGKPLANVSITTQPIGKGTKDPGSGSFGKTDAEGKFELELVKPARKGAIVGEHRIIISPPTTGPGAAETKQTEEGSVKVFSDAPVSKKQTAAGQGWPARYTDGSITFEVPAGGTDQAVIDLGDAKK